MSRLVYHTTRLENIPGIRAHGLLTSFRKDRAFERDSLGINSKIPMIYLSKDLHHLCIPPMNDRVVLQIDIPDKIYKEWDRKNLGKNGDGDFLSEGIYIRELKESKNFLKLIQTQ